jgi:hypothetical protein
MFVNHRKDQEQGAELLLPPDTEKLMTDMSDEASRLRNRAIDVLSEQAPSLDELPSSLGDCQDVIAELSKLVANIQQFDKLLETSEAHKVRQQELRLQDLFLGKANLQAVVFMVIVKNVFSQFMNPPSVHNLFLRCRITWYHCATSRAMSNWVR